MLEWLLHLDTQLFLVLNGSLHWAPIDAVMLTASEVKHFYLPLALLCGVLWWKGGPRGRAAIVLALLALGLSDQVASFGIKPLVGRLRPCHALAQAVVLGGCGGGTSFPSTHASDSVAFVTVLIAFYPRRRWWLAALAALICYSRIHLAAHYPLDVWAGALLGFIIARLLLAAYRALARRAWRPPSAWRAAGYAWEWVRGRTLFLPILSGVLLGTAFPPMRYGLGAAVGLVPLLVDVERLQGRGRWMSARHFYVAFFVFCAIANYWVGGWSAEADPFLMIACVALAIIHPLFFLVPMGLYSWLRGRFGRALALAALPFVWTAFEYLHAIGDLGYPWLTLGNTQTYYTEGIQFIAFTGVYGLSFLLVVENVLLLLLFDAWRRGPLNARGRLAFAALVACVFVPALQTEWVFRGHDLESAPPRQMRVAVLQPDVDPWRKWNGRDEEGQVVHLMEMSRVAMEGRPDLLLWPETAIPFYLTSPARAADLLAVRRCVDSLGVPLVTGVPHYVTTPPGAPHPADAEMLPDGAAYASYNATMLVPPDPARSLQFYHKMQLVPFGERTPFVDEFPFLANIVKWSVGLSGWSKGTDTGLLTSRLQTGDTARIYAMICYESVYPSLVRGFVHRGANLLTIVTNDGWYGRSPGPIQHQQFAVLRAIENRRAIARAANTGISCFIDPYGAVDQRTPWYEEATITGTCDLREAQTFYTRHGDWFAGFCVAVAAGAVATGAAAGRARSKPR